MKKFFILLDNFLTSILTNLATILIILLTIVVFVQVIFRYVLKLPVGGFGELPMFFMVLCIWISASINFRRDTHITIKVTDLFIKNKKIYKYNKLLIRIILLITISIFTILYWDYLQYSIESGDITPGLKLPQWWFIFVIFISGLLMLFFNIKHFFREIGELKELDKCQK